MLGVALVLFFLPQETPLAWWPADVAPDAWYLELGAASAQPTTLRLRIDNSRGFRRDNDLEVPVTPASTTAFFPLGSAPLAALELLAPPRSEIRLASLRVVDGQRREVFRFTARHFKPASGLTMTSHAEAFWLLSKTDAVDSFVRLEPDACLIPPAMTRHNLARLALSTAYATGMLTLALLGIALATASTPLCTVLKSSPGIVALAAVFALVAHRGLIRDTLAFAKLVPAEAPGRYLELDVVAHGADQLRFIGALQSGSVFNQPAALQRGDGVQFVRLPVSAALERGGFEFSPGLRAGRIIRVALLDGSGRTVAIIAPKCPTPTESAPASRETTIPLTVGELASLNAALARPWR